MSGNRQTALPDPGPFEEILARALPYLQTRHNEAHTHIARAFAERLLAAEGGDPNVVIPAIILHDIGWSQVPEDEQLLAFGPDAKDPERTKVHEREGARMAEGILRELGWPEGATRGILYIIAGHDTRSGSGSLEESVVRDADKLVRFSAVGFRIDCSRFGVVPDAYLEKIERRIDSWFFTATGATMAKDLIAARRLELSAETQERPGSPDILESGPAEPLTTAPASLPETADRQ